jgi:hypothetical protein|tara:strand:+ start:147 stop:527 length:381 start_codon:yes stop_codon:yes gene_type:complete
MKITTTLSPTIDEWTEVSWEEFNKILFNDFNSPETIKIREKNGECDINACFDLEFHNVHNEECSIEITLNSEDCDYRICCYTKLPCGRWEFCKDFEFDAKTPKRCIEIIQEHLFTPYKMLMDEEEV